jgi:hypothetical protein
MPRAASSLMKILDQQIECMRRDLQAIEHAREILGRDGAINGAKASPRPKRTPVVAGSLEDRILELAGELQPMSLFVERANAGPPDVRRAVKTLVATGKLAKHGQLAATRYVSTVGK